MYPRASGDNLIFSEEFYNKNTVILNNGTIEGTPTISNGATMNGSTDDFTYGVNQALGNVYNKDFTIETYVNIDTIAYNRLMHFQYIGTTDGFHFNIDVASDVSNTFYIAVKVANSAVCVKRTPASSCVTGSWLHLVAVVSTASNYAATKIYINGVAQTMTSTGVTGLAGAAGLSIGKRNDNTAVCYFDGQMKFMRVYSGAKTQAEVTDLYNNRTISEVDSSAVACFINTKIPQYNDGTQKISNLGTGADCTVGDGSTSTTYPTETSFDGGDYIRSGITHGTTGTMMCLFNMSALANYTLMGASDTTNKCILSTTSAGALTADIGSVAAATLTGGTLAMGQWHTAGVTWATGGNIILYLDGISIVSAAFAGAMPNLQTYIGALNTNGTAGTFFTGKMPKAKLDTKEFSATQMRWLHNKMMNSI